MSTSNSELTLRSKKQHIRLWFECLQICHFESRFKENLAKSQDFYEEWGDVTSVKFDDWWKQKNIFLRIVMFVK